MSLFQKKTANIEEQVMQDITDEQLTQVNGGLLSQATGLFDPTTDTISGLLGSIPSPNPQISLGTSISPSGIALGTKATLF
jgi:hypothetical protein